MPHLEETMTRVAQLKEKARNPADQVRQSIKTAPPRRRKSSRLRDAAKVHQTSGGQRLLDRAREYL